MTSHSRAIAQPPQRGGARTFVTFVLSGGVAALVNLIVRWVLSHWLIFEVAVTLAHLAGMVTAFVLTRTFVFTPSGGSWRGEITRFALVNVITYFQILIVSDLLVRLLFPAIDFKWHPEEVGHLIGVMSPVLNSYYAHKHFSFGRASEPKA